MGRQRAEVVSEREVSVAERCTKERMLLGILKAVDFRLFTLARAKTRMQDQRRSGVR